MHVCVCVYMYVYICVCMYVCMYVCTYVCTFGWFVSAATLFLSLSAFVSANIDTYECMLEYKYVLYMTCMYVSSKRAQNYNVMGDPHQTVTRM